ncbi:hypothetical protein KI387_001734 [Taxus chinensis]|uniref:Uncharacterized protein n=1 Tax=Taxus chinensis TaxID=29808 RepID=A0AA38GUZ9_TAXCH|nr:hypothetical protein KI387_001734 [Taxus chinensis]
MQEQTFIDSAIWKEISTMYDNNYVDPQTGCMLPADHISSGMMGLEENLQRSSMRLPNFCLGEVTQNDFSDEVGIGSHLQQQLNFELEQEYHIQMIRDVLQPQQDVCAGQQSSASNITTANSWEASFREMQELSLFHQQQQQNLLDQSQHISSFATSDNTASCTNPITSAYTPPPELLNLLQIPRCSVGSSTISFGSKKPSLDIFPILNGEMVDQNSRLYDPQLSFTPHSPCLRDILRTLPYQLNPPKSSLGLDENEAALQEEEAGR